MIIEGVVTTQNSDGTLNVAPMGPVLDEPGGTLFLRPFQTSTTWRNLRRQPQGVFHIVDDVLLLARAAIGQLLETPPTFPALTVSGRVLCGACRWFEFHADELDDREPRTRITARIRHVGRLRDWGGFNRARHAVIEAAILATRLHILPPDDVRAQFAALSVPVSKTAGPEEEAAFRLLDEFVRNTLAGPQP